MEQIPITGEVLDADNIQEHVEYVRNNLEAVIMLPGCGEESLSDLKVLDQLLQDFPNLKTIGIMCSWFINGTDISSAVIKPAVENIQGNEWQVGKYNRENAHQMSMCEVDGAKIVNYGGTVSDEKLLAWVNKAKELGLEIAFYPILLVDNPAKTWRGHITGNPEDVAKFYKEQYKPFIIHYANLLKGRVKIFYIGSELEGLNSIKDEQNHFPFVHKMTSLAPKVEKIFADEKVSDNPTKDTLLSYAANWTEYHSCHGGLRPLDNLWSHPAIDFVGIDYYMPLTNEQDKDLHNVESIKKGFDSGEGKDYYILKGKKIPFADQAVAWKNLKYWYENSHKSWDGKQHRATSLVPNSKRIVLSELGCRSVDRATDAPHLHGKDLPLKSNGKVDNIIQIVTIRAFLEYIKENNFIREGFCYGYDSRGENWQEKFADGNQYATGHWIDGKFVYYKNNA